MRAGKEEPPWGPKLCVAIACFKRDVLTISPSELDAPLEEHSLGIK